jgi:hypothetical protein
MPKIDDKKSIPPAYLAGGLSYRRQVGNRFLGSLKGLQIGSLYLVQGRFCHKLEARLIDIKNVSVHFPTDNQAQKGSLSPVYVGSNPKVFHCAFVRRFLLNY